MAMFEKEYYQFIGHLRAAMSNRYQPHEVEKIVDFFNRIKGGREYDLVGEEMMTTITNLRDLKIKSQPFDLYEDMMMRAWIYAPYILKTNP
jgi:hypothetical protein